jgi:serine/threonine protein kinase/Tol biopolymer transport system component
MPLSPHQIIDQYEILNPIGSGGMGEVYRARDNRLDRDVAIKVMPGLVSADPDRLRRFEQEARAAAALNHPNILAVYQMGTFEGAPYLVSELLEGETLRERLKRGPLPVRKVIDYGAQIARGLAAAHEKGIIHRDLKPENLFLTKDGQVKILDFGLARLIQPRETDLGQPAHEAQTVAGMVLGTVGYMSPEQVRGQVADHRSDIFAFSAVIHEMLGGQRAFQKPTSVETMSAILNEEPPSIAQLAPNTPLGLQRVLLRGLEKNPEQRFQSASDLGFALEALSDSTQSTLTANYKVEEPRHARSRASLLVIALVAVIALGVSTYFWMRPSPIPQVANYVQLTHDGLQKSLIGTDGSRLFLAVVNSGASDADAAAIQVTGGEPTKIAMPGPGMFPVDVSPDGSSFLVVDGRGYPPIGPFWSLPILGDSPRRLGDAMGQVGCWSADGKMLAYANGTGVFLAKADGTESRKLVTMTTFVSDLEWSPDGSHLRVGTSEISQSGTGSVVGEQGIWEVAADGSNPHRLLAAWHNASDDCCGKWTADGEYFVFQSQGQIWALRKEGKLFHSKNEPIQLTASPMSLQSPLPSRDGKKLFVVGRTYRGELTQFNVKTGQPMPYLGGISADWIDSSRDAKYVTYVSYPKGDLWKSNADGTERVQLTFAPIRPVLPRWSPDGNSILFFEFPNGPSRPGKIFQISAAGGTPRELIPEDKQNEQDATWSPDGKRIVFAGDANDASASVGEAIRVFDMQTRQISTVKGSRGLFSPRWSPDGRNIAAMTSDSSKLMLFDFQTQKWTEIGKGTLSWLNWSRDGQYIYLKNLSGKGAIERIRVSDHKDERVVELNDLVLTGLGGGSVSVGLDGSPLLLRDRGTQDVYSLDWVQP